MPVSIFCEARLNAAGSQLVYSTYLGGSNSENGNAIVVDAAGNDGDDGQSTISSPGIAPSAITVGASTNTRVIGPGTRISLSGTASVPLAEIEATSGESDQPSAVLETTIGPLPMRAVALEAGQTATVKIKLRAIGGGAQWRDYTGFVVITDQSGQAVHVPYWIRFVKKS